MFHYEFIFENILGTYKYLSGQTKKNFTGLIGLKNMIQSSSLFIKDSVLLNSIKILVHKLIKNLLSHILIYLYDISFFSWIKIDLKYLFKVFF